MNCPWPLDDTCLDRAWADLETEVQERSIALASMTLERLTGYRVGNCPITVRPHVRNGSCFVPFTGFEPTSIYRPGMNVRGQWVNNCGTCHTDEGEVALPAPVGRVDEVKVNGAVVDPADYRIDNGNILVWQGTGPAPWPTAQNFSAPDTEVGTFSVTYLNAYPVDEAGMYAVAVLAAEYGQACAGNKCRLPSGVTSIVRQGITMDIASGAFPGGLTGIREVDTFIALWNPRGLEREAKVWSPDLHRTRTMTLGGTP